MAAALHLIGCGFLLRGLSAPFDSPLLTGDFGLYFARALRARFFWDGAGRHWGYDPFSMAGYPAGAIHEIGSHALTLATLLLQPFVSAAAVLLTLEVAAFVLSPLAVWGTARNLGLEPRASRLTALLFVVSYGTFGIPSHSIIGRGFFPMQIGMWLGLASVSAFYRYMAERRRGHGAAFVSSAALLALIHPAAALAALPGFLAVVAVNFRRFRAGDAALIAAAAALAAALNAHWIAPYRAFSDWILTPPFDGGQFLAGLLSDFGLRQRTLTGAWTAIFNVYLVAASVYGLARLWRANRPVCAVLSVWIGASLVAPLFAPVIGPWRFLLMGELLLYVAAPVGLIAFAESFDRRVVPVFVAAAAVAALVRWADTVGTTERFHSNRLRPEQEAVLSYLKESAEPAGRTLIENPTGAEPPYVDLLPVLTAQHILGGSNGTNFLASRFTVFSNVYWAEDRVHGDKPNVFGRLVSGMDRGHFETQLRRYNVARVITRSAEAVQTFGRWPDLLAPAASIPGHTVWTVKRPSSWFLEGAGTLEASYDELMIDDAAKGKLVLSFHYLKTLKSEPPLEIVPVRLPGSPVPFIGIDNAAGARRIVIKNEGL